MNWVKAGFVAVVASVFMAGVAEAAKCSSTGGGFESWKKSFAVEAKTKGVKPKAISALMGTSYSKGTIRADRGQHSFKLSLNAFMAKRGAAGIIARGRSLKNANAGLFAALEKRYGFLPARCLRSGAWKQVLAVSWATRTPCRQWRRSPMTAAGQHSSPISSMRR